MELKELFSLDILTEADIIAGNDGLERNVLNTTFVDAPDGYYWCKKGDFILTTGYPFIKDKWQNDLLDLIIKLSNKEVSAIGIKLGRYIPYIPDEVATFANKNSLPLISIPNHLAWADIIVPVINHINKIAFQELERTHYIYEKFQKYLSKNANIDSLPNLLSNLINRNVTIYFNNFNKILNSNEHLFSIDDVDKFIKENYGDNNKIIEEYKNCTVRWIRNSSNLEGMIIIWGDHFPLDTWRKAAIEQTSAIVSFEIEKLRSFSFTFQQFRNKFIEDIIENQMDFDVLARRAKEVNWNLNDRYTVLLIAINSGLSSNYIKKMKMKERIIELLNKDFSKLSQQILLGFDKINQLVLLLPHDRLIDEILMKLDKSLKDLHIQSIYIGIGREYETSLIRNSYEESKLALKVLINEYKNENNKTYSIKKYNDLKIDRIVHSTNPQLEIQKLVKEYLSEVIYYDRLKGTDLLQTLQTFINENLNYEDTANSMFIHKNTVRYRINIIEKLTQLNLKENTNILFLQLLLPSSRLIK